MVYLGDCLEKLKDLEANSIDAVVTDPPYGWSFMGKAWDSFTIEKRRQQELARPPRKDGKSRGHGDPSLCAGIYNQSLEGNRQFQTFTEAYAKELFRVLKPGGHILVFCGPRTYHRMASGVEDAGFEIRDQLQWLFGSGFPKSHNLKDDLEGWGTALKPANEPIVLARKPLENGLTVAQNVAKWGTGGLNIDASRIGSEERTQLAGTASNANCFGDYGKGAIATVQGRWPANLLLDEAAAEMLDEQSGISNARGGKPKTRSTKAGNVTIAPGGGPQVVRNDSGGASRFFYVAKASKRERNAGLEGMPTKQSGAYEFRNRDSGKGQFDGPTNTQKHNHHPTVKPLKLMEYLIRLITPPQGTVLDPFMGSGSTGVAAKRLGFNFIGIEMNEEYVEIAKKRIESASA